MVWLVIWVVLMMFWLFFGCYTTWEPTRPYVIGTTIIPWLCVLILGLVLFGAIDRPPVQRL
jgi:hypothetical protein